MQQTMTQVVGRLLSRAEVAELLGVAEVTLAQWAHLGIGPAYFRVGRLARYRKEDIESWMAGRRMACGQAQHAQGAL
jgi:excisionase family DNA binding protein